MSPGRTLLLGAALALCVIAAFTAIGLRRTMPRAIAYSGTPLDPPKPVADFVLTGVDGKPAHVLDPQRPLEFLFFGYTHCPDECPLAMASLGRAYRTLTQAERARVRVVFVTVDPARDTPSVVGRYVRAFDPRFIGLTGSAAELARVWNAYGVSIDAKTKDIGHGDAIYAIDAKSEVVLVYPPDASAAALASDAAKLVL